LDSGFDYASDSDGESDEDSGYSSSSSYDDITESYEEMRAQFSAEGPVMPELSDRSKEMVKVEESRWKA
jgi:hypothetical protein